MHARRLILPLLVLAACAPSAHAAAPAEVRILSCTPPGAGEEGSVQYEARMRAVSGTERMAVRFRLFEKIGDGEFRRVATEGVQRSQPGAAVFVWRQRWKGLRAGAVYRSVVQYRWLDARGNVIESARRESPVCRQDRSLPNLRVASIDVRRGDAEGTAVYRVTIVNRGDSAAKRVGVLLRVDGEIVDEVEVIRALQPGETKTISFTGPVCRERMRVVVDPKQLIAESREQDNTRAPACL